MISNANIKALARPLQPIALLETGGGPATPGGHGNIAYHANLIAKKFGIRVKRIARSHAATGVSHYVKITGHDRRLWIIRISDHARTRSAQTPHFEIISHDGAFTTWVNDFLVRAVLTISDGSELWFDPAGTAARKAALARKPTLRRFDGRKCG